MYIVKFDIAMVRPTPRRLIVLMYLIFFGGEWGIFFSRIYMSYKIILYIIEFRCKKVFKNIKKKKVINTIRLY